MTAESAGPTLPGADLVERGVDDLRRGRPSVEALLVAVGAPRLRRLGVNLPDESALPSRPEHRLYDLLAAADPRTAHGAYNALIRRLVSFERAMELMARRSAGAKASSSSGRH